VEGSESPARPTTCAASTDRPPGTRANLTYLDQLAKFHRQHGSNLNRFPSVDKRPLDLYKLKKAVESRGGFEKVCKLKKWAEIGRDLGYSGKIMSSLSTSLKNSYQRWLHPYEEYLRFAKPGVQAQLEFEYGGPLTPSPANSPMKKSTQNTPSVLRDDSPAIRASDALNASFKEVEKKPVIKETSTPPVTSGFTAVNTGGFTPVNSSPATFTSVNPNRRQREPESSFTPPRRAVESPVNSTKNTPEYRPSALSAAPMTNGHNPLKRQLSTDSLDSRKENSNPKEDSDGGGRRSKRLKKGIVTLFSWGAGICCSCLRDAWGDRRSNWRNDPQLMPVSQTRFRRWLGRICRCISQLHPEFQVKMDFNPAR
jgi:histone demethylase JARID1